MVQPCLTEEDVNAAFESSEEHIVGIFKHSPRCPISLAQWEEFIQLAEKLPEVKWYYVDVIGNRSISNFIAQQTQVKHESPQLLLIHRRKVFWHASHFQITQHAVRKALQQYQAESLTPGNTPSSG